MKKLFLVLPLLLLSNPTQSNKIKIPTASETHNSKAYYKIGKSYVKNGKRYKPCLDKQYTKIGTASYYGKGFHNKLTANGDTFNKNDITAAHPTLPMFSKVWVTNLETGKKILVTVNDRGPYRNNRIIDLSEKTAEILEFKKDGTVKVRVEYDHEETERYLKARGLFEQYKKATSKNI